MDFNKYIGEQRTLLADALSGLVGGDLSSSSYVEASVSEPHVSEMATQDLHMHSRG